MCVSWRRRRKIKTEKKKKGFFVNNVDYVKVINKGDLDCTFALRGVNLHPGRPSTNRIAPSREYSSNHGEGVISSQ